LERTLVWNVWERMLEIEFIDRSVALAGKAFVSFFPLVIVVAAFLPEGMRSSIIDAITLRFGLSGEALTVAREAFASSDDLRRATGLLGLLMTIFFASSFTTALQRVYFHTWRRPRRGGISRYWRGAVCLLAVLACMWILGGLAGVLDSPFGGVVLAIVALAATSGLWWFISWFLLLGDLRARALVPTGVITALTTGIYAASATVWMPGLVTDNEAQFGVFGVALALITWFSGSAICVLVGACAGAVLAEDPGRIGAFIRGGLPQTLSPDAPPPLTPPGHALSLRNAFGSTDDA